MGRGGTIGPSLYLGFYSNKGEIFFFFYGNKIRGRGGGTFAGEILNKFCLETTVESFNALF